MRRLLSFVLCAATAGCGIDESGLLSDASSLDSPVDTVADVVEEPYVCADAGVATCADAAAFRAPALYAPNGDIPCPSGYNSYDLANASASAATCTCQCTNGPTPSCDTTTAHYHTGTADCSALSGSLTLSGSCTTAANSISAGFISVDPPAVTGGCGGGTPTAPGLTSTKARLCVPTCASDERVCSGVDGLKACVYAVGDVGNCPPDYTSGPFFVGGSPAVQCDPCSCTPQGDCTQSQFHYFSLGGCTGIDQSIQMNGACNLVGGVTFLSDDVAPSIKNYTCSVTTTFSHVAYGSTPFTVCCK